MYKAATVWEYTQFTRIWTALCVFNNMQQVNKRSINILKDLSELKM